MAVAIIACNPVALSDALVGDSHAAAAFFLVWGLFFLAHWVKRSSLVSAFIAGLLFGIIPSIRYPEAIFGIGIGCYFLIQLKRDKSVWPGAVAAVIGAAIPLAGLMAYNQIAFGAVWRTSYDLTMEQTGFSWT